MKQSRRWELLLISPIALLAIAAIILSFLDSTPNLTVSGSLASWVGGAAGILTAIFFTWWLVRRHVRRLTERALFERANAISLALQEAHQESEADRNRLFRRLDHELKNPLTVLRLSLGTAIEGDSVARKSALATAADQTERLATLVEDLRKVAEVRSRALELESVEIGPLLEDVRQVIAEAHPATDQERTWSIGVPAAPWPLPAIQADPSLLFLAVHNLAENAVKYSRPHDKIELRGLEEANGHIVIEVADTGMGIPEAEHAMVWEELTRAASTARSVPGSGLGLPLVAAIVARHHGTVQLRSRPGEGTVIRLILPQRQI